MLWFKERANVFLTDAFKQGFFEVQDANSLSCRFP
jgi:16S rRNA (cytosine967-C5)-methyltransferase